MVYDPIPVIAKLASDLKEVWGVSRVFDSEPLEKPALPFGWVRLTDSPIEPLGTQGLRTTFGFELGGRFKWKAGDSLNGEKAKRAQAILKKLTEASTYAGCILPYPSGVVYEDPDLAATDPTLTVRVTFTCQHTGGYFE